MFSLHGTYTTRLRTLNTWHLVPGLYSNTTAPLGNGTTSICSSCWILDLSTSNPGNVSTLSKGHGVILQAAIIEC